ncbi:BatD family protein [Shewanella sp. AS1]|uniref:BatD family protein n=1 Tax=Shewanella sp. AS1 TaxID=2907626 RepID=UPI001F1E386F|nr:BatD family protein [Shewanella sp. AS1]MCE9679529.1 BatD family protein [Shewanella sp. AS1]
MVKRSLLTSALLAFTLLSLGLSSPAFALAKLETSVDRNPAVEGEYLVLTITADDDVSNGSLDTRALLKDFTVGRTSVSRSTQILNFDASKETRWQVLIAPKHSGIVTIPAFTIEKVSSNPIALQVVKAGSQPEQRKNLFIRTTLSTEEAYVGQLITYKVKLYLAVELQRGVLSAPNVEGAQLKQLGDDLDTTEILDGRRYRVIERTYSVIADKPGKLSLSGASFSGDVLMDNSMRDGRFSFNQSRPMQAKSAPSEITVLPVPESYHGNWLVSDLVVLKEEWSDSNNSVEVGTPITRNISLLASNADETSLPEIKLPLPESFKSYPEKPQKQTFVREKRVVAQLTQTTAIVPTMPGTYTLPEIRLPWWNSQTQKQEFATLPKRTITVTGAANTPTPILTAKSDNAHDAINAGFWPYLTALFVLLWLLTLALWYRERKRTPNEKSSNELPSEKAVRSNTLSQLKSACTEGDSGAILFALQQHFTEQLRRPMTLEDIAKLSPALRDAINTLQSSRYGRQSGDLNGVPPLDTDALLRSVEQSENRQASTSSSALSPLNPL